MTFGSLTYILHKNTVQIAKILPEGIWHLLLYSLQEIEKKAQVTKTLQSKGNKTYGTSGRCIDFANRKRKKYPSNLF